MLGIDRKSVMFRQENKTNKKKKYQREEVEMDTRKTGRSIETESEGKR